MNEKIKVLIADDAAFMRKTIRKILESEDRISIVGTAKNGQEAVKMNNELLPDVVTLDIDMPVMDGITALKHMMIQRPVPTVVVSSLSYETNVTFEAFRLGIVDFIPKPTGAISTELEKQKTYLCETVMTASTANTSKLHRILIPNLARKGNIRPVPTKKLVIIGSSLGGTQSIMQIISMLSAQINFAVVAMLHMSSKVMDSFIQKLDRVCQVKVSKARRESILYNGEIYLYSLDQPAIEIQSQNGVFVLQCSKNQLKLPIDHIMQSAAKLEQLEIGAILLAGNGPDGLDGFCQIHKKHGKTIVQKAVNALFPEKPNVAIQKGIYGQVVNDVEIADQLTQMMK